MVLKIIEGDRKEINEISSILNNLGYTVIITNYQLKIEKGDYHEVYSDISNRAIRDLRS